ncbi:MAG: metallophosphoesterase [Oscillospiraceae bacterium]|nr:metallophosphoesterase [Oscillospiraceae bacterium]
MTRILVVSDSHGHTEALLQAARAENPDLICHLGDYERDARVLTLNGSCPVHTVCGNCDLNIGATKERQLEVEGIRIFMTHGHSYRVKNGLDSLLTKALYENAGLLLFGHTHQVVCQEFEGMMVVNPGSIGYEGSYAVVQIEAGSLKAEIKQI